MHVTGHLIHDGVLFVIILLLLDAVVEGHSNHLADRCNDCREILGTIVITQIKVELITVDIRLRNNHKTQMAEMPTCHLIENGGIPINRIPHTPLIIPEGLGSLTKSSILDVLRLICWRVVLTFREVKTLQCGKILHGIRMIDMVLRMETISVPLDTLVVNTLLLGIPIIQSINEEVQRCRVHHQIIRTLRN